MTATPTPPSIATHTRVRVAADVLVVEFFFGDPEEEGTKIQEVGLSLTGATSLMVAVYEKIVDTVPKMQTTFGAFSTKLAEVAARASGK